MIKTQNFQKEKNRKKNVFLAGPYDDNIDCYCIGTEEEFVNLVQDYFLIKDSGTLATSCLGEE